MDYDYFKVLKTSICLSILLTGGSLIFSSVGSGGCSAASFASEGSDTALFCALTGLEEAGVGSIDAILGITATPGTAVASGSEAATSGGGSSFTASRSSLSAFPTRLLFFVFLCDVPACVLRCLFSSSLLENDLPQPGKLQR